MNTRRSAFLAVAALIILTPTAALAYVGPGAGLTAIATFAAVAVAAILAVAGLVVFPIRLVLRKARAKKDTEGVADA